MIFFWDSSEEQTKNVDTTGTVNNNVVIDQTVPIHNDHLVILLYIITVIKVLEFIYILFKVFVRKQKKKYLKRGLEKASSKG